MFACTGLLVLATAATHAASGSDDVRMPQLPEDYGDIRNEPTMVVRGVRGGGLNSGFAALSGAGRPTRIEFDRGDSHVEQIDDLDASTDGCGNATGGADVSPKATAGNPIIVSTGNKIEPELDFDAGGLRLERVWNQHWDGVGIFGYHWLSSFDFKLSFGSSYESGPCYPINGEPECQTSAGATIIWAHRPNGRKIRFLKQAEGLFLEDKAEAVARIVRQGDGTWQLQTEDNSLERYRTGGLPLQVGNEHGVGMTFQYGGMNGTQIQKVTHTSGREAVLTWTGDELTSITAPGNAVYRYTYSHRKIYTGRHLLASTEQPGVVPLKLTYHYETTGFLGLVGKSVNDVRYSWFTYDDARRATSTQHANGAERVTLSYQTGYQNGKPALTVTETNPLGHVSTHNFLDGKVVSVQGHPSANCLGSVRSVTYDAHGYRDIVTGPEGEQTDYDYNAKGQLLRKIEAVGEPYARVTTYTWDAPANRILKRTVDGVGGKAGVIKYQVSYTYNARNYVASETITNLSSQVPASQNQARVTSYVYAYHPNGLPSAVTVDGPLPGSGDAKTYSYAANGNLLTVTTASGVMAAFEAHDAMGRPGRVIGPNGAVEEYTYDAAGRVLSSRRSVNWAWHTTTYGYDGLGRLATVTRPDGVAITTSYDAAWRPVSTHYPEPGGSYIRRRVQYNAMSLPVMLEMERLGSSPAAPVDGSQYLSQVIPSPLYTDRNVTFTVRMKNTGTSIWSTDGGHRLVSLSPQFSQAFGVHSVDIPGAVHPGQTVDVPISVRTPTTIANYVFQWRLAGQGVHFGDQTPATTLMLLHPPKPPVEDPPCPGCAIHRSPVMPQGGAIEGLMAGAHGVGYRTYTDYDELGRVMTRRGNDGQRVDLGYDRSDRLVISLDAASNQTQFEYDKLGRLVRQIDAKAGVTLFTYDINGKVTSVTDPRGNVTHYLYDGFGQLWSQSSPDTGATTFHYSSTGLLTSRQRADGSSLTYQYDPQGRVTVIDAGTGQRMFAYDSCLNGRGLLCSATRLEGGSVMTTATFDYTPQGQLAGRLDTGVGVYGSMGYAYDGMGRVSRVWYPSGLAVDYVYSGGHLESVHAVIPGAGAQTLADQFAHDVTGEIVGWRYANGIVHRRERDLDGRISGISSVEGSTVYQSLTYGYDSRDLITAITDGVDAGSSQQLTYDELARLTGKQLGGMPAWHDQFDPVGNRAERLPMQGGVPGTPSTYTVAAQSNRLLAVTGNEAGTFQYNPQGNLVASSGWQGSRTWTYDGFDRPSSSSSGGHTTSYVVNALDQRVLKAGPQGEFRYVYAGQNTLLAQHEASGWKNFVYLGGQPIATIDSSWSTYFIHADHLARPHVTTDMARQVVWKAANRAYHRTVLWNSIGTGIPLGFPGQIWDEESQTWHNGFRDYDPFTGRYIQSDPIGLAAGLNTYAYVGGNPVNRIDPYGLWELPSWARGYEGQLGVGVTAFGVAKGGSLGLSVGISDTGLTLNAQGCAGLGGGAYIGAGLTAGVEKQDPCPAKDGVKRNVQFQAEGGKLLAGGATVDLSGNGGSVGVGDKLRGGVGVGGYAAVMGCVTKSWGILGW